MKKLNMAILTVLLVFQTILSPLGMFGVTFASTGDGTSDSLVKDVVIKQCIDQSCLNKISISEEGYRVSKSESVYLEYKLDVQNKNANDIFVLTLPSVFKFTDNLFLEESGDINAEITNNGLTTVEKVGSFRIIGDDKVEFTLTNGNIKELNFVAWSEFVEADKTYETSVKEKITIPTNSNPKVIEYWTEPSAGDMFKTGKANKLMNADSVKWTIDINKGKQKITDAKLADTMVSTPTTSLNLKSGTKITAKEIGWDSNGNEYIGSTLGEYNEFPLNLGDILSDGKVVRIEYTTAFTTTTDLNIENKAVLSGKVNGENVSYEDEFVIDLPKGKHLAKSPLNTTDSKISWQVLYNFDSKNLKVGNNCLATQTDLFACGVIEDELQVSYADNNATQSTHTYDESSIQLYLDNSTTPLVEGTDYQKNITDNKLKIILSNKYNGQTNGFRLMYDTITTGSIYASFAVNNTVKADGYSETNRKSILQQFFTKTHVINYETQEIAWKISATGYDMKGAVLTDASELDIKADSLQVKVGGQNVIIPDSAPSIKSLELNFGSIDKEWSATDKLEVTYITPLPDVIGDGNYNNTAGLKWKITESEWIRAESISKTAVLKKDAIMNGYKNSQYNYTGNTNDYRTIDWEVGYNFNRDNTVDGKIKDVWDYDQLLVDNSIKIYPVKITSNGSWEKDKSGVQTVSVTLTGKRGFTADLSNFTQVGKPYIISYKTEFENGVIPKNEITNTFTYGSSSTPNKYSLPDDITINSGGEFVSKSGTPSPKYIDWSVYINKSQSTIPAGATLTDSPINQQFVTKSGGRYVTITKLKTTDGVTFTKTGETFTDFTESYDATNNTLTITFNEKLEAAYVMEYKTYIAMQTGDFINNVTFTSANGSFVIPSGSVTNGKTQVNASGSGAWANAKLKSGINGFNGLTLKITKTATGNGNYFNDSYQSGYKENTYLQGVEYELFTKKNGEYTLADTKTTIANGIATFNNLAFEDHYYVREKTALPGYKADSNYYPVDLSKEDGEVVGFEKKLTNSRIIYDASFKTCKLNEKPAPGKYEVTLGNNKINVTIDSSGIPSITNTDNQHKVSVDSNGIPTFNSSGLQEVAVDVYNDNIRLKNLPAGEYTIKQIEAQPGYKLSGDKTVSSGNNTAINNVDLDCNPLKVTITNQEPPKDTNIPDNPHDGSKITGSTFKLYELNGKTCPVTNNPITDVSGYTPVTKYKDNTPISLVTNSNGLIEIYFSKLGKGTYIVIQENSNSYYVNRLDELVVFGDSPCIVVDKIPPTNTTGTFTNVRDGEDLPAVKLIKKDVDETNRLLEGAVITLTGEDKNKTYVGKTDDNGEITVWYAGTAYPTGNATPINKIVADKYTLNETVYPKGYTSFVATKFDYHNGITTKDATIVVTNKKILSTITIENKCGIEVSTYKLVKANDATQTAIKTDLSGKKIGADGVITLTPNGSSKQEVLSSLHLEEGTYKLVQLSASAGCEVDTDIPTFNIVPNTPTQSFKPEIDDKPIKTPITNIDEETDKPIPDSTFKVYKSNNSTSCPLNGGAISEASYTDVTNLVPGATQTSDGDYLLTTGNNGKTVEINWSKLGNGKFVVVQDKVNKYYVNKQNVPVQIDTSTCYTNSNTKPTTTPFENLRKTGVLKLVKSDEQQPAQPVKGATIQIVGQTTGKTYTGTTNSEGEITSWMLVGTTKDSATVEHDVYVITETDAPKGYDGLTLKAKAGTDTKEVNGKIQYELTGAQSATGTIHVENKRLLTDVKVVNQCGKGESTYELWVKNPSGTYEKVTTDAAGKTTLPIIKIEANTSTTTNDSTTVQLHIPEGDYKVVQVTGSLDDCLEVDHNPPTDSTPDFTVTQTPPQAPIVIDETDKPIFNALFTFKNCKQEDVAGTYTLTGTSGDANGKVYTVEYTVTNGTTTTVIKDGTNTVTKILTGDYKVTGTNTVDRTIKVTTDSNQIFNIATENCGEIEIEFISCLKDTTGINSVDIYKKGSTVIYKTVDASTNWNSILAVGDYTAYPGGTTANGVDFTVTSGVNAKVTVEEPCKPEKIKIDFEACDKLGTTTVDIYKKVTTNGQMTNVKVATADAASVWTVELPEGDYVAHPGGSSGSGVDFTVGKTATQQPIKVIQSCGKESVTLELKTCEKVTPITNTIDLYKTDVNGIVDTTSKQTLLKQLDGSFKVDLEVGKYIAYPGGTTDNGKNFEITKQKTQTIIIDEPCPAEEITFILNACDNYGATSIDIYKKDNLTTPFVTIDATNNWQADLLEGDYIAYPGGSKEGAEPFTVGKKSTTTVTVDQPCYTAEISFKNCSSNATTVDYIMKDTDGKQVAHITTLTNGKATLDELAPGKYTVTKTGTNSSTPFEIKPGQTTNTTLTIINAPCPAPVCDKDVTITVTPGATITIDGKTHTDSDNDGKITVPVKDLPKDSTLPVTENGKTIGTVDTSGDCEATYTPAPACTEAVITLKNYANETVTISKDGDTATTAKVDADGKLIIPHQNGEIVVYDAEGNEIGKVTIVDCKGTFEFTNACTAATITIPSLADKTVTAEHDGKTMSIEFDKDGKAQLPFTDGKVTLKEGQTVLGSVDLENCEGTFVLETSKETCTYPESVTIPTEHAGKTATVTNGSTTTNVVVPQTGLINITFTEGTTTVTVEGTVVATVTEECKVVVEKEEIPVVPVKPDEEKPEPVEPEKPVDPTPEPKPEPEKPVDPAPTPEKPTEPKPTPQKPVTPSKPTPGTSGNNSGSGNNTGGNVPYTPGSTSLLPKVTDITNKWKNTISTYPQASITKQAEQDLLTLVEEYKNMTESQRKELEKIVDIDKVYDILIAEGVIPANAKPSFLPQTNGSLNTAWTYVGFVLVLTSAFFLLRRRNA